MALQKFLQQQKYASFIDGHMDIERTQHEAALLSPVTQLPWKTIVQADGFITNQAIVIAERTFQQWREISPPKRAEILRKIGTLLIENKDSLAYVMAMEMGKPIKEGVKEVAYAADFYFWFAGEAERIYGQIIPSSSSLKRLMIIQEPIGVCGVITPWNFPLAMGARKMAAALAAGCTVVVKPSSECPLSMLSLAELCHQAGLPNGVMNVVVGPEQEIGKAFLDSDVVRKISFTGSCEVGKYLYRESSVTLKKLTLELGGHAPLLVYDDANIKTAVEGTIVAKFRNNGQTCVAANRILVQQEIYEKYVTELLEAISKLIVGDPTDPNVDVSNVLHPASTAKVEKHIQDALSKGAKAVLSGKSPYHPTVLTDVTSEMDIFYEETFGPVAPITIFDEVEEGINLANDSEYGLAAYVFTESLARAKTSVERLQYGIIGLNDGLPSCAQASFGGVKHSGFGREGGPSGLREYLVEKFISAAF